MADDQTAPQRRRGRLLEDALLEAAWLEIKEHGWSDFSMSRTADRAGASKKSLYARWPDKGALVAATLFHKSATRARPFEPVGDLREDLRRVMSAAADMLAGPMGTAVRGLYASLPTLPSEYRLLTDENRPARAVQDVLDQARANGQLGEGPIPPRVIGLGTHLVTMHYLGRDAPPDAVVIEEILDHVWLPSLRAAATEADVAR
ncbi:MAG TPA: TetR/AcrR family transcriptional regulator [Nocardioides sp.]|uniref:TetR/AcrR family transcriptional regulator n=1 Tax=Nocardioides sp. TaxID=35761 RepID=UPI002C8FDE1E|nr:TetR/AcrR family transcriptional regulator [Nocardioides sp.]HTW13507.1 TetR/AcrR family transcriptional regulator [Nocardioides sp.]